MTANEMPDYVNKSVLFTVKNRIKMGVIAHWDKETGLAMVRHDPKEGGRREWYDLTPRFIRAIGTKTQCYGKDKQRFK